ncbi:MAG: long-chain fatty acid--CoA ligase [Thermoanaerobaculia bacterium]
MTEPVETVLSHLWEHADLRPDATAFAAKVDGEWVSNSWADYRDLVACAGRALLGLGLKPGDTVGILGLNRPEWAIGCLGTMAAGAVPVGIYHTCAPNQVGYLLGHAESRVVIVENAEQWDKVRQIRDQLPALEHVVLMAGHGRSELPEPDPGTMTWEDFMAAGLEVDEDRLDRRRRAIRGDQLASLIYTSGTTGTPKGVMLSHANVVDTCRVCIPLHGVSPRDRMLSYLPLAHIAEQMLSIHMAAVVGYSIYYAESPQLVAENLREVEPTIFFGVPRVWERMHAAIQDKLRTAGRLKRWLARWAVEAGREVVLRQERGELVSGRLARRHRRAERLFLSKVRAALGFGKVRYGVSGAAPIPREILEFFFALGVPIYEVYGLSESSGPGTWNHAGRLRLGTVGPAIPEVAVRVADDGEVLFRGPNVFQGYYKNPEATAETLVDGWLYTGDLGVLDEDGFLIITGRKKELIITSGGKNIAPVGIESALKQHDLIAEVVVIGDNRRFLSALVTLDPEAAAGFAEGDPRPHESPRVMAELERWIEQVNQGFSRVEKVRKFRVLARNFTVEDGELTPTLKLKRSVIAECYADLIEEMYA